MKSGRLAEGFSFGYNDSCHRKSPFNFFTVTAMRTTLIPIVVLPVMLLIFSIGCTKTKPEPIKGNTIDSTAIIELEKTEPLVIKLEPRIDPPEVKTPTEETTEEVPVPSETSGITAEVLGKYAAETIPLPPVDDLTAQVDEYITKIGSNLDDLDGTPNYAQNSADIARDANALTLVALALGLADDDSKYKKSAPNIISAAQTLAAAKNYDDAQLAYDALKASLTNTASGDPLSWSNKVGDLSPIMKALPNLSSAVKRTTDTERKLNQALNKKPPPIYSQLAALAVISQGSIPNVAETPKPDAAEEWKKFCEEFRDAALKVNAAARQYAKDKADDKEDYKSFNASFKAMTESCDHCHKVFYPSAVGKD